MITRDLELAYLIGPGLSRAPSNILDSDFTHALNKEMISPNIYVNELNESKLDLRHKD